MSGTSARGVARQAEIELASVGDESHRASPVERQGLIVSRDTVDRRVGRMRQRARELDAGIDGRDARPRPAPAATRTRHQPTPRNTAERVTPRLRCDEHIKTRGGEQHRDPRERSRERQEIRTALGGSARARERTGSTKPSASAAAKVSHAVRVRSRSSELVGQRGRRAARGRQRRQYVGDELGVGEREEDQHEHAPRGAGTGRASNPAAGRAPAAAARAMPATSRASCRAAAPARRTTRPPRDPRSASNSARGARERRKTRESPAPGAPRATYQGTAIARNSAQAAGGMQLPPG